MHIVHGAHPANDADDLYWDPGLTSILSAETDQVDLSTLRNILISCRQWAEPGAADPASCRW